MNPRIIIRRTADAEVDDQCEYLAHDNIEAARRFLNAAEATFAQLARTPGMGRMWQSADERLRGVRVWRIGGFERWLVFYRPIDRGIEVLHVIHGARDIEAILEWETK